MSEPERVVIGNAELWHGECREVLPLLEPVSAVVTDPPYGIKFMGKRWDYDVPSTELWALVLDRLLPGAHMLAFAGTRTQHRMAVRIEDAGFEIRDMLAWVYGSGFPKSLDVGKAIDKAAGADRNVLGQRTKSGMGSRNTFAQDAWTQANCGAIQIDITEPATEAARQWDGWGTALKPAFEPITLARKPLVGTVAQNVQTHGTGALNIDGCRVDGGDVNPSIARRESAANSGKCGSDVHSALNKRMGIAPFNKDVAGYVAARAGEVAGRWPANLIHDGSDEVLAAFPHAPGQQGRARTDGVAQGNNIYGALHHITKSPEPRADAGSAARFFYCAKAAAAERGEGNDHPTVKPLALMRWLLTLVVPPGGLVLDPFLGSGSTGVAAIEMGMRFIGIERDRKSFDIACARIEAAQRQGRLLLPPGASDQPPAPSPIQALL